MVELCRPFATGVPLASISNTLTMATVVPETKTVRAIDEYAGTSASTWSRAESGKK